MIIIVSETNSDYKNMTSIKRLHLLNLYLTFPGICEIFLTGWIPVKSRAKPFFFLQRNPEVTDDNCCECMKTLITADGPTTADQCATAGTPKTVITESLQRREKNCLEFNKAINKEWKWPFQDGTWNFVQTFFLLHILRI